MTTITITLPEGWELATFYEGVGGYRARAYKGSQLRAVAAAGATADECAASLFAACERVDREREAVRRG